MDKFMTDKKAKELAETFLKERSIPDVAGHSDCLAKLLQECFKDGCQLISEKFPRPCTHQNLDAGECQDCGVFVFVT